MIAFRAFTLSLFVYLVIVFDTISKPLCKKVAAVEDPLLLAFKGCWTLFSPSPQIEAEHPAQSPEPHRLI